MKTSSLFKLLVGILLVTSLTANVVSAQTPEPADFAATYAHAAVAADQPVASLAGLEMLKKGGNAVDAAVATSFCLSVVRPMSCGIGGGGFMVIYDPNAPVGKRSVALNYREVAPAMVGRDYYVKLDREGASRYGVHASGVPGTVAGLLYALEKYGTLDRATVLGPAIRAAEEGFAADASHVGTAKSIARTIAAHPEIKESSRYIYEQICHKGEIEVGDLVRNPDQAKALKLIAEHGAAAFYEGEIADAIVAAMEAGRGSGGSITAADLGAYQPREMKPLVGEFKGHTVLSMPPPSSGGIAMQQILGILEYRLGDVKDLSHDNADYIHLLAEAMKHAFADRAEWLADSAFVEVPIERLTGKQYITDLAKTISMRSTIDKFAYGTVSPMPDDGGTSHISVIDANGMAVACTETINTTFGSMVVVEGYGFALNNQMDDFTTIPGKPNAFGLQQSDKNLPEPGKRPLSSMSPTIVLKDGRVKLVSGAAGGPRIITGTLQSILNCLLFEMTPGDALSAPRIHHQWMPHVLRLEAGWKSSDLASQLQARGHKVSEIGSVAVAQLILIDEKGIHAASDPRRGGRPAGY